MSVKIVIAVFAAFAITFSLLGIFSYLFPEPVAAQEKKFYSQTFNPNLKKIFIFGASDVVELNNTFINDYVSKYHNDTIFYNLGEAGDTPERRLSMLNHIISLKPEMVFYGLTYWDFDSSQENFKILPDPQTIFSNSFSLDTFGINLSQLNPQLTTLMVIRGPLEDMKLMKSHEKGTIDANTPFFSYMKSDMTLSSESEIETDYSKSSANLLHITFSDNPNVKAVDEIIKKLQENNIKVVIFTTPLHRVYLDGLSESNKNSFNFIVSELQDKYNLKIYNFTTKYADLPIWRNSNHVTHSNNGIIYSKDVANMILNETDKN